MIFAAGQGRLLWLGASVLLYALGTTAGWYLRWVQPWMTRRLPVVGVIRFVYYIGVPYVALLTGVVTLRAMGMASPSEMQDSGRGLVVALGALALMAIIWWHYAQAVSPVSAEYPSILNGLWLPVNRPGSWAWMLITIGYQQVHWAFYRALPLMVLEDRYLASFLALAIILLEMGTDPAVRHGLRRSGIVERIVFTSTMAVISTVLFDVTASLWLPVITHILGLASVLYLRHHDATTTVLGITEG